MAEVLYTPRHPMRSASSTNLYDAFASARRSHFSIPDMRPHSPESDRTSSLRSTSSSSLSLEGRLDDSSSDDDQLAFPDYKPVARRLHHEQDLANIRDSADYDRHAPTDTSFNDTPLTTPDPMPISEDDSAVRKEPSHHVDYLSYEWREEDIWSSWRHIVEHRSVYGERSRLENASWRTWAKSQFKLRTVSPETLNW